MGKDSYEDSSSNEASYENDSSSEVSYKDSLDFLLSILPLPETDEEWETLLKICPKDIGESSNRYQIRSRLLLTKHVRESQIFSPLVMSRIIVNKIFDSCEYSEEEESEYERIFLKGIAENV